MNKFQSVKSHEKIEYSGKCITGGKEVELTSLSGRIPEQRLVQK